LIIIILFPVLKTLYIKNFALIKEINLDFRTGFTVITGETGAGKSIMLEALSLVLGSRVDSSKFSNLEQKCIVEVQFDLSELDLKKIFEKEDLDYDSICIFRREISRNLKSRSFINDTPVSLNLLKKISAEIININAQQNTSELNSSDEHLKFLDDFCSNEKILKEYKIHFKDWKNENKKLEELLQNRDRALRDLDYDRFQYKEILEAQIDNLNFSEFKDRFELISNAEDIKSNLLRIDVLLGEDTVSNNLKQAISILGKIATKSENLKTQEVRLLELKHELEDVSFELSKLADDLEIDPNEKMVMEERLDKINTLFFKHRVERIEDLKKIQNELDAKIQLSENSSDFIKESELRILQLESKLESISEQLRKNRIEGGRIMVEEIRLELNQLKMESSELDFSFEVLDKFNENGKDAVSFLLSSDGGQTFNPLRKSASGGELSRIMLSIKSVLSKKTTLPSIIFDEVDTGVSGDVARRTGELLKNMSSRMQVIAISHLPQVASLADVHCFVYKESHAIGPVTKIKELDKNEKVEEIAKMLSGDKISPEALENAKVLIAN